MTARITELDVETDGIYRDGPRCAACGDECRIVEVDFGVGFTEYWGYPKWDSQVASVSNCCEAEVEEW